MNSEFIKHLFQDSSRVPRGELWVSGTVLKELGLAITQESIIILSADLGADICFFSYTSPIQNIPVQSREMKRLISKARNLGLICGVTVDGPFQRTVKEHGFMETMRWFYKRDGVERTLEHYTKLAAAEMEAAEESGADLIVLCDDIAYKNGLYFSPQQFSCRLMPLYKELKKSVKEIPLGFHSDGNIEPILHSLCEQGFSIFSLEPEAMDLQVLCRDLPKSSVLLSGIKSAWLMTTGNPAHVFEDEFLHYINSLQRTCHLILASLCGLYDLNGLNNLRELYKILIKHDIQ